MLVHKRYEPRAFEDDEEIDILDALTEHEIAALETIRALGLTPDETAALFRSYEDSLASDDEIAALSGASYDLDEHGRAIGDENFELAFDPSEPRDPEGKWTDGGGDGGEGKGEHPGEGYSKNAWVDKNGVIHTSNVYDAQRALFENRKVELKQPKQISTLIKRLGETAAEMEAQGEAAPVFNLCNVSVEGTNLFCAETKGIPRVEMPVIPAKQTKAFIKYLKGEGYKVEKDTERAAHLRATQSEISGAKVAASMKRIQKEGFYKRLVVSRDDYILDGHHTWAGQLGVDFKNGNLKGDKTVKVARVDISITKLIAEANKWTKEQGIAKKPASEAAKAFDPDEPRDEAGKWTSGGGNGGDGTPEPVTFVSPNTSNLTFDQAVAKLDSVEQRKLATIGNYIDGKLGISGSTNRQAIGAWSDGAENSMMITAPHATDAQIRAASAMKGYLADQKAVLLFTPDAKGQSKNYTFDVKDENIGAVHDNLLKDGLAFHTLEDLGGNNYRVHAIAMDQETQDAVERAADRYDANGQSFTGNAEFLGTGLSTGTDREQRDDARHVYEQTISKLAAENAISGRDIGKAWDEVRDYWGTIAVQKGLKDWDESKHPREPGGSPEGGEFTSGGGAGGGEAESVKLDPKVVEVGGDEWNKATARRLEREYQAARPKLEALTKAAIGQSEKTHAESLGAEPGEVYDLDDPAFQVPESWDELSADQQSEVEEHWMDTNFSNFYDSEVDSFYENDGGDYAKVQVVEDYNKGDKDWADDAIDEVLDEVGGIKEIEEADEDTENPTVGPIPYTKAQLLDAINLGEWEMGGSYKQKLDVQFDDDKLQDPYGKPPGPDPAQLELPGVPPPEPKDYSKELTEDMRERITEALQDAFKKEADKKEVEVPEYVTDSTKEYMGQYYDEMSDDDKFEYAKNKTNIIDEGVSDAKVDKPSTGEVGIVTALPKEYDPLNETTGADYRATQKLARYMSVQRTVDLLQERQIKGKSATGDFYADKHDVAVMDRELWEAWKGSSTTEYGKLLQVATADELGGRLNPKTSQTIDRNEMIAYADRNFDHIGGYAGVKAYIRAKWETTQFLLDKAGVKTLGLYRGYNDRDDAHYQKTFHIGIGKHLAAGEKTGDFVHMTTLDMLRNGAVSTTTDRAVANKWKLYTSNKIVLRAIVPRTAALSVPAYGINEKSEHEVVIAGTAWTGWDAWAKKAPSFESVPLKLAA